MSKLRDTDAISPAMATMLGVSLTILFVPLFIIILLSFNTSPYGTLPFIGTFKWYEALFTDSGLLGPTWLSLELSLLVRDQRRRVRHHVCCLARSSRLPPRRHDLPRGAAQRDHRALADPSGWRCCW